jgi:hypothetical protein
MSEEAVQKIQDALNLAAVGEADIETLRAAFEDGLEKLEYLEEVRGEA